MCLKSLFCSIVFASTAILPTSAITSEDAIVSVKTYGNVDLEGAKPSAIIIEYKKPIRASQISPATYEINNYVTMGEAENGFAKTIEIDYDNINGDVGQITRVYVNSKPEPSPTLGTSKGKYVIIELNTAYMLQGANLAYASSMIAGVKQVKDIGAIKASDKKFTNYEKATRYGRDGKARTIYIADRV